MKTFYVKISEQDFEYDINNLIRAFYPEAKIRPPEEGMDGILLQVDYIKDLNEIKLNLFSGNNVLYSAKVKVPYIGKEYTAERVETKNILKRALYRILESYSKRDLPWGTLTGIRPVKLPMRIIKAGGSKTEAKTYLMETYLTSERKAVLATDIAVCQYKLTKDIGYTPGISLYIGIPFCPTRCLYCSFASYPAERYSNRMSEYVDALRMELEEASRIINTGYHGKLNTIYIGGGTPVALCDDELDRLFKTVEELFDIKGLLEYTCEAGRPDAITDSNLAIMKAHGISRISINPQTMNQYTLNIIGRKHTPEDTVRAFERARASGFDNINADIILGLPNEGIKELDHTLSVIKDLAPESLTVHSLAVKRSSAMNEQLEKYLPLSENSDAHMDRAANAAYKMGMKPYYLYRQKNMSGNLENTGFSLPGKEGLYNILIMEEDENIYAVGAGTVSKRVYRGEKFKAKRCDAVKNLDEYLKRAEEMIERKRDLFA